MRRGSAASAQVATPAVNPGDSAAPAIPVREILDAAPTREEREHRAAVLAAIEKRMAETGAHIARPDANRSRQFKPFAALKGFDELIREAERASRIQ